MRTILQKGGTADAPDPELLSYTVNKFSFEKQTGRKQGEGNAMSRKRKGLVGDWKKFFQKIQVRFLIVMQVKF